MQYAPNKKMQVLGYKYGRFWGSVGMGILWGFPRDFAVGMGWVWGFKSNPRGSPENRVASLASGLIIVDSMLPDMNLMLFNSLFLMIMRLLFTVLSLVFITSPIYFPKFCFRIRLLS